MRDKIKNILTKIVPTAIYQKIATIRHIKRYRQAWLTRGVTEECNPLQIYWNSTENENKKKLVDLICKIASSYDEKEVVHILEYGSHVGINIRMIDQKIGTKRKVKYYAIEPNRHAFEFMREKLPFVHALNGEDSAFISNNDFPGHKINISFANAVFYSMDYRRVFKVCQKLYSLSDILVIGDELINFNGEKSKFMEVIDFEGKPYKSLCHPYRKILSELGFKEIDVLPLEKPCHAIAGLIISKK